MGIIALQLTPFYFKFKFIKFFTILVSNISSFALKESRIHIDLMTLIWKYITLDKIN